MSGSKTKAFCELDIYKRYEALSDLLWDSVEKWPRRHQIILGDQVLRAVDSIGANIAEAVGRWHFKESLNLLFYARGSLVETQHWIRVAVRRNLLDQKAIPILREHSLILSKQLSLFIQRQRPRKYPSPAAHTVEENAEPYGKKSANSQHRKGRGPARRQLPRKTPAIALATNSQQLTANSYPPPRKITRGSPLA